MANTRNTHVYIDADDSTTHETVAAGASYTTPVIDLSAAHDGGVSLDLAIATASGSPTVSVALLGGNYRRATLADMEVDSADLPDLTLPINKVVNIDNARVNFAQFVVTIGGTGSVTISAAVAKTV